MQLKSARARLPGNVTTTILWGWFAAGALLLVAFPPLRQHDPLWGWLPFWCVVAPLIDLAFVQRGRLRAAGQALRLAAGRRRRTHSQAIAMQNRNSRRGMRRRIRRLGQDPLQCIPRQKNKNGRAGRFRLFDRVTEWARERI